jgi:hypothetical protein
MSQMMLKKVLLTFAVVAAVGFVAGLSPLSIGQEGKDKKAKGRLPTYYADIVTDAQRQEIYTIQEKYAKKIADVQAELDAITSKRDAEIESVLNAEQKRELKKARDEAAAKKKKAAEEKKASEEKTEPAKTKKPK